MSETYLPDGLPTPIPMNDGLDKPYWDGLLEGKILVQRCGDCGNWQWVRNGFVTVATPLT